MTVLRYMPVTIISVGIFFTLDLDDDSILCNKNFKGGKLWTFQQMEHNLGRNFFSSCLEYEFEHLEAIIYTREKYKES